MLLLLWLVLLLIFDQKGNYITYMYFVPIKYKIFLDKGALPPYIPRQKLKKVFFLSVILCEFSIFDQKGNEIAYLRPIKYKISYRQRGAAPLQPPPKYLTIFFLISLCEF